MHARLAVPAIAVIALLSACVSAPAVPPDELSPLERIAEELFGIGASPEDQEAYLAERHLRTEELIAACMREQGFDYTPAVLQVVLPDPADSRPDDREWVAQYGYGLTEAPGDGAPPTGGDPVAEHLETLSPAERAAYEEALWGRTLSGGAEPSTWELDGCAGDAQREIEQSSVFGLWEAEEVASLLEAIAAFEDTLRSEPRIREIESAWAACMGDAGFPGLEAQADAQQQVAAELERLRSEGAAAAPLRELGDREVRIALADLDCRAQTEHTARLRSVRFELEQHFVDEHRALIDAAVAVASERR